MKEENKKTGAIEEAVIAYSGNGTFSGIREAAFLAGASWQSKQSYSEQEVIEIICKVLDRANNGSFMNDFVRYDDLLK